MTLDELGRKFRTDKSSLYHNYLNFYQEHLPREFTGTLLEIGVMDGASLRMWAAYYPKAHIVGVDIKDKRHIKIPGVEILLMDATKPEDIQTLGNFDIILDDGSHNTLDQQISFNWFYYNKLNPGGLYILEDLHTSLMPNYVNSELTTLEFLENLNMEITHYRRDPNIADSMTCVIRAGQ